MTPILGWAQILRRIARRQPARAAGGRGHRAQCAGAGADGRRPARHEPHHLRQGRDGHAGRAGRQRARRRARCRPRRRARARHRNCAPRSRADLPPLRADPHRLQQILWNLLSNAVKFTPPGGHVDVSRARRPTSSWRSSSRTAAQGIPADFLPHVFERFRQVDSSITRSTAGWASALRSSSSWSNCTAAPCPSPATARTWARHSPSPCRCVRWRRQHCSIAPMRPRPPRVDRCPTRQPVTARPAPARRRQRADALLWLEQVLTARGAQVTCRIVRRRSAGRCCAPTPPGRPAQRHRHARHRRLPVPAPRPRLAGIRGGQIPAIALTAFVRSEDHERASQPATSCTWASPPTKTPSSPPSCRWFPCSLPDRGAADRGSPFRPTAISSAPSHACDQGAASSTARAEVPCDIDVPAFSTLAWSRFSHGLSVRDGRMVTCADVSLNAAWNTHTHCGDRAILKGVSS